MNVPSKILNYAGRSWKILRKVVSFTSSSTYLLIYGVSYSDGYYSYISYLKDMKTNKLVEVLISKSELDIINAFHFNVITYA